MWVAFDSKYQEQKTETKNPKCQNVNENLYIVGVTIA